MAAVKIQTRPKGQTIETSMQGAQVAARADQKSGMIHIRLDDQLKDEAMRTLGEIGISLPEAVRVFLKRVVREQAFPFKLEVPNSVTRAAMGEGRRIEPRFLTPQELFDDLEAGDV